MRFATVGRYHRLTILAAVAVAAAAQTKGRQAAGGPHGTGRWSTAGWPVLARAGLGKGSSSLLAERNSFGGETD